jgi:hypothetical protein
VELVPAQNSGSVPLQVVPEKDAVIGIGNAETDCSDLLLRFGECLSVQIILLDVDALGLRLLLCLLFFSVAPPQPRQKHSATPFEDVGMRLAASRTLFISAANYSYGDFGGNTWATKVWRGWIYG